MIETMKLEEVQVKAATTRAQEWGAAIRYVLASLLFASMWLLFTFTCVEPTKDSWWALLYIGGTQAVCAGVALLAYRIDRKRGRQEAS